MTPTWFPMRVMRRLAAAREGSSAVEFAILGPIFLLMILFVFQFATALQAYNGLVGATADLQRQVTTQDQSGNPPTASQIQSFAIAKATSKPYHLSASRLSATAKLADVQRISGATEYTVSLTYAVPVMVMPSVKTFQFTFKRSVFVKAAT